jgi:uncharacterized membrane protein YgdD (TMEM256/DUF423 family)
MSGGFFVRAGAVLAGLGVIAGAFGAHYLRERLQLEPRQLDSFETGVRYQLIHSLAMLVVGLLALHIGRTSGALATAGWLFLVGTILFSGSIYLLALSMGPRAVLGPTTPIGGSLLIVGWFVLAASSLGIRATP